MSVVIIKYNAGNIQSVLFALERIGVQATVTDNQEEILSADKIIFPGVGEASTAMEYLKQRKLDQVIASARQPLLGICLGMQLLCKHSQENNTGCLGIFDVEVKRFESDHLKIPQIGWNNIYVKENPLFKNVKDGSYCYFVHSYYAALNDDTIATTPYGIDFSCALNQNNFYGVQFHPEKSADIGEQILKNFLSL
ncbi:MAG TPA: imidazole glycerol phosphate synthase subunit HisH [Niabella sp.]|nr:imidazole glycerol phosphate synthase subunit HisH [Niabella sp.]HOZ95807.1 imidazole glycerol phosphate synthase subunit HisH [Niabella sp.]HQW13661.1 imidazole glycerol phosphate synthase subunit HisH [Niabella sp.]HQX19055.1 imidazole glycerol phosphate synthase subunit HisH [Niabella sp.]HQX42006.1 imidazole glycerol phosphate synthase subunit HisH [Niabella sp.]